MSVQQVGLEPTTLCLEDRRSIVGATTAVAVQEGFEPSFLRRDKPNPHTNGAYWTLNSYVIL